jgi:hypothetical protein
LYEFQRVTAKKNSVRFLETQKTVKPTFGTFSTNDLAFLAGKPSNSLHTCKAQHDFAHISALLQLDKPPPTTTCLSGDFYRKPIHRLNHSEEQ